MAVAAEPLVPVPETVGDSVQLRSWPQAGKWITVLSNTTFDRAVCATFAVDRKVGFGLRAKDNLNDSLSLAVGGPMEEILSSHSIGVWIDGFLLGDFPVTRRVQSPTGNAIHATVPTSKVSALLDLFGSGQWVTFSTGTKTYSAQLEGSDTALKALRECTHELTLLNSLDATVDLSQVERRNWIAMCERGGSIVGNARMIADALCLDIWERRAAIPQFSELSANLKAVIDARVRSPASNDSSFQLASARILSIIDMLEPSAVSSQIKQTLTPTSAQSGDIMAHVRECWTKDSGAVGLDKMSVVLNVVTDATGTTRSASVADEDRGKLSDPVFQAFAARAVRAVMDVRCATLPLPKQMQGRSSEITFRFRP